LKKIYNPKAINNTAQIIPQTAPPLNEERDVKKIYAPNKAIRVPVIVRLIVFIFR